jgi:hypothetical protein
MTSSLSPTVCADLFFIFTPMDSLSFALRKFLVMQTTLSENNELETNKVRPLELGLERVWMQNSEGQETPQMVI